MQIGLCVCVCGFISACVCVRGMMVSARAAALQRDTERVEVQECAGVCVVGFRGVDFV